LTQHKEIIENRKAIILAKEKAEESDHLKTSFLMNLSHELRTPMNGIIGFTELLQKGNTSASKQQEYLSYISSSGQQLLKVMNDIIDIASIETAQLEISNDHCNLHDVLSELFQYFDEDRQRQGKENVKFIYQPPENAETIVIFSDRKRLTQIISNLLDNAFKFTKQGSVVLSFEITSQNKLKIKVQDTGIGIERSMTDMIFDRFRQIDGSPSRQHGGSGLGLAICKELTVLMNGKIIVESELGKGSLFIVELPLQE
jgi:signal transduction histidine kinase